MEWEGGISKTTSNTAYWPDFLRTQMTMDPLSNSKFRVIASFAHGRAYVAKPMDGREREVRQSNGPFNPYTNGGLLNRIK